MSAAIRGRRRAGAGRPRAGASDRRPVLTHRRRDADGRSRARDQPSQPDPRHRGRHGARRGRRHAHRSRSGPAPRGPLLSAGARRSWAPTVGGTIATNAAGAATFKYGTTRDWVNALTVVLPNGERARHRARRRPRPRRRLLRHRLGRRARSACRSRATACRRPPSCRPATLPRPEMDLIDLFIGSEGTLGVVTEATLRVLPVRPAMCLAFVPFALRAGRAGVRPPGARPGARHVARARSERHRRVGDRTHGRALPRAAPRGRRRPPARRHDSGRHGDGAARHARAPAPARRAPARTRTSGTPATPTLPTVRSGASAGSSTPPASSTMSRWRCRVTTARANQLLAVREAVPAAVNQRVGRAKQTDRRADREDRRRHGGALRSARRAADGVRDRHSAHAASTSPSGATSRTATSTRT